MLCPAKTLCHLGYEAEVIDYREPFTELIYNPIRWDIMKQGLTRPRLMGRLSVKGVSGTL